MLRWGRSENKYKIFQNCDMCVVPTVNSLVPSSGSTQTTTWRTENRQWLWAQTSLTLYTTNREAWLALNRLHLGIEGLITFSRFVWNSITLPIRMQYWKGVCGLGWTFSGFSVGFCIRGRSSVTNLSSENNLLTFRLNVPVVIRAKVWSIQSKHRLVSHPERRQVIFWAQVGNR